MKTYQYKTDVQTGVQRKRCAYIPGPRRHSRSLAGIVLAMEELETVELLGGRATGSPLTAAVCATQAPNGNEGLI